MFIIFILLLRIGLILLNLGLREKHFTQNSKQNWFESGIENKIPRRQCFSLNFFLICLIFVIFDLEVIFVFCFVLKFRFWYIINWIFQVFFLIIFIFLTLLLEWKLGTISWKYFLSKIYFGFDPKVYIRFTLINKKSK